MKGKPLPHTRIRIVNSRNEAVAPGFEGEILIKGTFVVTNYWSGTTDGQDALDGESQLNDENFTEDGWFRSGRWQRIQFGGSVDASATKDVTRPTGTV